MIGFFLASLLGLAPAAPELLLVANKADNTVTVIDVESGASLATLPTGAGPHEVAVSADGRWAVTTDYGAQVPGGTLTVIDLASRSVVRTIDLSPHRRPHGAVFLPNGRLLVTSETSQALLQVDVARGVVTGTAPTNARGSHLVAVPADARRAYTANIFDGSITEIDLESMTATRTLAVSQQTEGVAVTPDGRQVWLGSNALGTVTVIDVAGWAPIDTLADLGLPYRVNAAPVGGLMIVSNPRADSAYVFDAATRTRRAAVFTGAGTQPVGGVVSRDGRRAYLALQGTNQVAQVDLQSGAVLRYFSVGARPDGVAITASR